MKGLIFTYALTCGGAIVALIEPYYGFLIYVAFYILRPEELWFWSVPAGGNYSRIVGVALLVGWLIRGIGNWNFARGTAIVFSLLGFWIWMGASAFFSSNQETAWYLFEQVGKIVLPFLVGITVMDSKVRLKQLAWVICLCYGFVAYEFNLRYYGGGFENVSTDLRFGGLDNNGIALAMVVASGLSFFLGLSSKSWWQRGVAFASSGLTAHVVLFSYSRGGMLALALTGVTTLILLAKQPKHYWVFAVALLVGLRLAGKGVRDRFSTVFVDAPSRDASAQSRIDLAFQCWETMLQYPVFGIGPGHWNARALNVYGWGMAKAAHNTWLEIGAELGFPGLGFLAAFYGISVVRLRQVIRNRHTLDPEFGELAQMVIASLAGFVVAATFVTVWGVETPYYIVLIGVGALKLASQPHVAPKSVPALAAPKFVHQPQAPLARSG